jgi:hypothetical protein
LVASLAMARALLAGRSYWASGWSERGLGAIDLRALAPARFRLRPFRTHQLSLSYGYALVHRKGG